MFTLTSDRKQRVAAILSAYPEQRAAVLPLLWLVMEQEGCIPDEALGVVAELAGVSVASVHEVKSFYAVFSGKVPPRFESGLILENYDAVPAARRAERGAAIISRNFGEPRMAELEVARQHGAYVSLAKLKRYSPEQVKALVMDAGLRGRGGAGFPTGKKWSMLAQRKGEPVTLVINADEGEPGTFKDRAILMQDPHLMIEGIAIAAYAINAERCYLYLRAEYAALEPMLTRAIAEAREAGMLAIPVVLHRGAGAYICGEESSLLNSLEGRRGEARPKPPYPTQAGLFGSPTVVQNVETLCSLPFILREGAAVFRAIGTPESPGTKLVSISGDVGQPGVYEVPMGTPIAELIADQAGGMREGSLKALLPGGASSPVLTAAEALAARCDFESLAEAGSALGSGGMIAVGEGACMVRLLSDLARFFAYESCGYCAPCREGSGWIARLCDRAEEGRASHEEINTLIDAADGMAGRTVCGLGNGLAAAVVSIATKFRREFEDHVRQGKCPHPSSILGEGQGRG